MAGRVFDHRNAVIVANERARLLARAERWASDMNVPLVEVPFIVVAWLCFPDELDDSDRAWAQRVAAEIEGDARTTSGGRMDTTLDLPTEPTWGIVVWKYGAGAELAKWSLVDGGMIQGNPGRRSDASIVGDFIPLDDEQVARIARGYENS